MLLYNDLTESDCGQRTSVHFLTPVKPDSCLHIYSQKPYIPQNADLTPTYSHFIACPIVYAGKLT